MAGLHILCNREPKYSKSKLIFTLADVGEKSIAPVRGFRG